MITRINNCTGGASANLPLADIQKPKRLKALKSLGHHLTSLAPLALQANEAAPVDVSSASMISIDLELAHAHQCRAVECAVVLCTELQQQMAAWDGSCVP